MAVRERNLEGGIAWDHAQSVIGEMEIADDFGAEHACDVRSGGGSTARGDLLSDAAAADDVAAFEDEGRVSGASEIGGGGEAVVTGADDDDIVKRVLTAKHTADRWSKQETTTVEETK